MDSYKPLISVIVPVYNVGEFLTPCLESLRKQTYQNLEILLIDDGSTDGSGACCDAFQQKDARFHTVHKKNGGVSSARNLGLDIAQGAYIAFVDSDDRVEADYLETLYRDIIEQEAEAAFCGYRLIDESGTALPMGRPRFSKKERVADRNMLVASATNYGIVWGGLIARSLIGQDRFTGLRYGEDSLFMFDILCRVKAISQNPYVGYLYMQRDNSATATQEIPNILKARDHLIVHAHRYLCLPETAVDVRDMFFLRYASHIDTLATMSAQPRNRDVSNTVRAELREHLQNILPHVDRLPSRLRAYILLFAKAPTTYCLLARLRQIMRGIK